MKRDKGLEKLQAADLTGRPIGLVHGRRAESLRPAPSRWARLRDLAWTLWRRLRPREFFDHEGRHLGAAKVGR